jgi:drug/metabolite transporter (DMT)-like permease
MSRRRRVQIWRYVTGIPLALLGIAIVVGEALGKVYLHIEPSVWLLAVGCGFAFAGGYLINDTLTTAITDAVLTRLPQLRAPRPPERPGGEQ